MTVKSIQNTLDQVAKKSVDFVSCLSSFMEAAKFIRDSNGLKKVYKNSYRAQRGLGTSPALPRVAGSVWRAAFPVSSRKR